MKWYRHSHRAIFGAKSRKEVREVSLPNEAYYSSTTSRRDYPYSSRWAARPFPEAEYTDNHSSHTLRSQPPSRWAARPFPETELPEYHHVRGVTTHPPSRSSESDRLGRVSVLEGKMDL